MKQFPAISLSSLGFNFLSNVRIFNNLMDEWMTYDFASFSTVFQSYQDDGRMIMKTVCNGTPFTNEKNSPGAGIEAGTVRSPGRVAQSVGHLNRKSGVLGLIPGLATYFRFSFRYFRKDSCQLLAKVCARSSG